MCFLVSVYPGSKLGSRIARHTTRAWQDLSPRQNTHQHALAFDLLSGVPKIFATPIFCLRFLVRTFILTYLHYSKLSSFPYLQEISKGRLPLGLALGQLHRLAEVVDEVRVDLQHHRFGERRNENIADFLLLKKQRC